MHAYNKYLMVALLFLSLNPLVTANVFDSENIAGSCSDVLKYTGREERIIQSLNIGEEYNKFTREEAKSLGLSYEGASVDGSSEDSENSEMRKSWRQEYFSKSDLVFGPAVAAWKACMVSAMGRGGLAIKAKSQADAQKITFELIPVLDTASTLQGVAYPENDLDCNQIGGNTKIRRVMKQTIKDKTFSFECTRKNNSPKPIDITVTTGSKNYSFVLPQAQGPDVPLSAQSHTIPPNLTGCDESGIIDAAPYRRQVRIDGTMTATWDGPETEATVTVLLNKMKLSSRPTSRPADATPQGKINFTADAWLEAFTPYVIRVMGGAGPIGSCKSTYVTFSTSEPTQRIKLEQMQ